MRVLSAAEMQACDRLTAEQFGVPSLALMRNAAAAVAAFVQSYFVQARRVTVLCGRGNNGGDGLMTARLLAQRGLEVTTILLGAPASLKGDAADAWRELATPVHGSVRAVTESGELASLRNALKTDLVIDAVVGTGFQPPLKGLALAALEWLHTCTAPVLAIDLPSGWPADVTSELVEGPVFPADAVVTFTSPKPAHVFGALTRKWNQPIVVAPIGSPDEAIRSQQCVRWAGSSLVLAQAPRSRSSNKGNFGHVLVVGGAMGSAGGKAGAPTMASLAALRTGAGLVTAAVPAPALPVVASYAPELMTMPLTSTRSGEIAASNGTQPKLAALLKGKTVLAVGPGLGQSAGTAQFLAALLSSEKIPIVMDADALNLLAARPRLLAALSKHAKSGRPIVLTPHPGEMARLCGKTVAEVQENRVNIARNFAKKYGVTLVLKGWRTLIAHPDGEIAVNTTGNPGMAKGGSGDVLTGIVAGMLAQHPAETARAVEAAVCLHGLAADIAVRERGERVLLATDTLNAFSQAFRFGFRADNGYVWLQGLCSQACP
ncbi:MAG: NAD(P)H-hydrate dehydratase [Acidobacteriota bacterium]|nr:NAD(P)H-hydrate dehydratase [Acidobacteriota bacterium]